VGSLVDNRRNINSDKWLIYRVGIYSLGNTVSIENTIIIMVNQTVTPFNPRATIKLGQPNRINRVSNQRFIAHYFGNA